MDLDDEELNVTKNKCKYCLDYNKDILNFIGHDFKLIKTAGYKENNIKYKSWIMKGKYDKKAGIMITEYGYNGAFFEINYCPMCGRKLGD